MLFLLRAQESWAKTLDLQKLTMYVLRHLWKAFFMSREWRRAAESVALMCVQSAASLWQCFLSLVEPHLRINHFKKDVSGTSVSVLVTRENSNYKWCLIKSNLQAINRRWPITWLQFLELKKTSKYSIFCFIFVIVLCKLKDQI